MSLFSAFSVSLSGLSAITSQLQLTANNIANAGQDGYTRKGVTMAPIALGNEGGGTQITGYTRATESALSTTLNIATADAGLRDAQNRYMQQVLQTLGATNGENPALSDAVTRFATSWSQLAAAPESSVNKQQVVQMASNLVLQIKSTSEAVEALDRQAATEVRSTVSDLNSALANIADLNTKISQALNAQQATGDLEDQRDKLVQTVASITRVTVMQRPRGQIALYTPSGYALMDGGQSQSFTYNGTDVYSANDAAMSLNDTLGGGRLQGLVAFRATATPPSAEPGVNAIQKLRDQLDLLAEAFTTSSAGPPETFAYAYANAASVSGGNEATSIFTGADRTTLAVNASLLDGTETIKSAAAKPVAAAFANSTKNFSADGLSLTNASYTSLATGMVAGFQQAANSIQQLNATSSSQQSYLKQRLSNETGVNVDTEIVALTTLQNAYAASARVMSVIQQMFSTLESITTR